MSIRRAKPKEVSPIHFERILLVFFGLVVAITLSFLTSVGYERFDDEILQVWFFDVGQGDAIFLITPHGQQVLVDAGPDISVLTKLGQVMPFWDRSIDTIVLTHYDADHITGFVQVLDYYQIDSVLENGTVVNTPTAQEVELSIGGEEAKDVVVHQGEKFEIDGVRFDVLWPSSDISNQTEDRNETSVVLLVTYGKIQMLLTGDAEETVEQAILGNVGDIDVLKVGHHGSLSSSSSDFLAVVSPEYSIISCGENNRYGHPHPVVLERLLQVDSEIFRTDQDGDILLSTDGKKINIRSVPLMF